MELEELLESLGLDAEAGTHITAYANAQAAGLKRNNTQLKAEKRALQSKVDGYAGLDVEEIASVLGREVDDIDLDDLPALIAAVKGTGEITKDDPRVAELERKLEKANKRAETAETESKDETARLRKQLGERDLATLASAEIVSAKGSVKALMPHIKGRIKTEIDEDGDITHIPLAPNGEPMEDASGNPATIKMLIDEFRRDEDLAANFSAPIEGGGMGTKRPGNRGGGKKWSEMSLDERSEMRKSNPALADRMKSVA